MLFARTVPPSPFRWLLNKKWPWKLSFVRGRHTENDNDSSENSWRCNKLAQEIEPDYNFALQYEDPEFNKTLCNQDIYDLPQKPTIKMIPVVDLIPVSQSQSTDVSSLPSTDI